MHIARVLLTFDPSPCRTSVARVQASEDEFNSGYLEAEKNLLKVQQLLLTHISSAPGGDPVSRWRWKQKRDRLLQQLLGLMQKLKMFMLHPVVGYCGREVTKLFAPSRCKLGSKTPRYCVCCLPSGLAVPIKPREEKEKECTCTEVRRRNGDIDGTPSPL